MGEHISHLFVLENEASGSFADGVAAWYSGIVESVDLAQGTALLKFVDGERQLVKVVDSPCERNMHAQLHARMHLDCMQL